MYDNSNKTSDNNSTFIILIIIIIIIIILIAAVWFWNKGNTFVMVDTEDNRLFAANLSGRNEVPPNDSEASGFGSFTLSKDSNGRYEIKYDIQIENLEGAILEGRNGSHIHQGGPNENGSVLKTIFFNTDGKSSGKWTTNDQSEPLTEEDVFYFKNGLTYLNVHTTEFPGGEIRSQILPVGLV